MVSILISCSAGHATFNSSGTSGHTDLTGTSQRPNEPISMGMPFGAGPGPEVFGVNNQPAPGSNADLAERVRAIASLYPNPALLQLLMDLQA